MLSYAVVAFCFKVWSVCILQTKQLTDMKVLLRDSAERERMLMQEKQELEQKVCHGYHCNCVIWLSCFSQNNKTKMCSAFSAFE